MVKGMVSNSVGGQRIAAFSENQLNSTVQREGSASPGGKITISAHWSAPVETNEGRHLTSDAGSKARLQGVKSPDVNLTPVEHQVDALKVAATRASI